MAEPLRVGVVGVGFGSHTVVPAFTTAPGAQVTAVCSRDIAHARAAAAEHGVALAFDDYAELIAHDDVDLVCVCTPPATHHEITTAVLEAGKHVLSAKPLALRVDEARELRDLARERPVVNSMDLEMRFIPVRRLLRELVADGFLGELRLVTASVVVDFGTDPAINVYYWNWLSQRALGGGITRASFLSHHLDLLRFTFGDIADIGARTATAITERPVRADRSVREASPDMEMRPVDTEDTVAACGTFVGGAPFTVAATWSVHHPSGIRVEAYGSEGTLVLEPGATPFEGRVLAARVDEPGLREVPVPERFALPVAGSGVGSLFHALAADVVRHVGDPAYEHVHATFEDGVATLELADAIVG